MKLITSQRLHTLLPDDDEFLRWKSHIDTAARRGILSWKMATTGWTDGDPPNVFHANYLGHVNQPGAQGGPVYTYRLSFTLEQTVDENMDESYEATVDFYVNTPRDTSFTSDVLLASDIKLGIPHADDSKEGFKFDLSEEFALHDFEFPEDVEVRLEQAEDDYTFRRTERLTRMKTKDHPATFLTLTISPVPGLQKGYEIFFESNYIESVERSRPRILSHVDDDEKENLMSREEANSKLDEHLKSAKARHGYVDDTSYSYIPENATKDNWDFSLNRPTKPWEFDDGTVSPSQPKENVEDDEDMGLFDIEYKDTPKEVPVAPTKPSKPAPQKRVPTPAPVQPIMEDDDDDEDDEEDLMMLFTENKKQKVIAQQYDGFFSGEIPEAAVGYIGTSAVDASQVRSVFGKTDEAIQLVNQYNASLLESVSSIFDFSKGGAYGVYLSGLDKDIKTKELQKKLEAEGYRIEDVNGLLTAYPTQENKSPEEIKEDIDRLYADIEGKGGTVFGINTSSIVSAAQSDAAAMDSQDPELWQWIAVLHLGGTIVHEATHAKGHMDEGPAEDAESKFSQWALPIVNNKYRESLEAQGRGEEVVELQLSGNKRHAKAIGWYKKAQFLNYLPKDMYSAPTGSDLDGRFPNGISSREGRAPWGMLAQQDQNFAIEEKLSREYMSPLPEDIVQEHQSIEEQLRRYTRGEGCDPDSTLEELLMYGHEGDIGYMTTEGLLEELRPKPLMIPIKKDASIKKIEKKATLFGWMNNLDISDGSTIPGMGDRVMAWEDRDESFAEEESWIKSQPRYNPEYDIKGFYYRWIEPRFKPQLFDDMTMDYTNTHPAKRWASVVEDDDTQAAKVMAVMEEIDSKIANGKIRSTRLIMTADILSFIEDFFKGRDLLVDAFSSGECGGEEIYSVWVSAPDVDREVIVAAEKAIEDEDLDDLEDKLEDLFRVGSQKKEVTDKIIDETRDICSEYGVNGIHVIGGYVRALVLGSSFSGVRNIDFGGEWPNQTMKIGSLLAKRLGAKDINISEKTAALSFTYKGIDVNFNGGVSLPDIKDSMASKNISATCLNEDICSRDFTVNMLAYDVSSGAIKDIGGESMTDIGKKVIKTFIDPEYACSENPLLILKALAMAKCCGFGIDRKLRAAMRNNGHLLFESNIPESKLIAARESVKKEGKKTASELFKAFGIEKLEEM